jgi:hypothetical protein
VDAKPGHRAVVEMRYRLIMAYSTKRLFSVWIPLVVVAIMAFLVIGKFITGNVDSLWSWIEVLFLTLLAIYFSFYALRARHHIER